MNFQLSPEVAAAIIGALCLWAFQLFDKIRDRRKSREATLVAIASEVRAICNLVRTKRYFEAFHEQANFIRSEQWQGISYVIDIRGNYFKTFDTLLGGLSTLSPSQVSSIVSFYTYCQSAIDSTRPDGPFSGEVGLKEKAELVLGMEALLTEILNLGDCIVQFPKAPLPRHDR